MVKLRAFVFGSVVHLYWDYTQRSSYAAVDNIIKIINFLKKFTFCTFFHMHNVLSDTHYNTFFVLLVGSFGTNINEP